MNLTEALLHCRPGSAWELTGNNYAGLVWRDEVQEKPTLAELETAWEEIQTRPVSLGYAEAYQVRAWMIRGGLDPSAVPAIIAAVVPESVPGGINRAEAVMRWEYATRVPRDFPLVNVIGSQMNLTPAQIDAAWPEIQTL